MAPNRSLPNPLDPVSALPEELSGLVEAMGQPGFRGRQIFSWIQRKGVCDFDRMTDLPAELRRRLAPVRFSFGASIAERLDSADGTRKLKLRLGDGRAVETVLIPDKDKLTQCVSCQVGCKVGCVFCRSGHGGFVRNLTAAEIVSEVQVAREAYRPGERLQNIVFMGVGEPMHNLKAVLRALEIFSHPDGIDLSTRRVTLSTVGVKNGIRRLGEVADGKVALAVSLHAADEETRRRLVPGAPDSLDDIISALEQYRLPKRRRFTIEYVLIKGINDSGTDARALVKRLSKLKVKVNLLPLNPHDKTDLEPPDEAVVERFRQILLDKGMTAILRKRRGADIGAACGQLLALEPA